MIKKKIKILYCEDEAVTRKMVMLYLDIKKYDYYIATNGEEGLELYKKHQPDILITDISMPKMTGIELIEEVQKLKLNKPHIIITTSNKEMHFLLNAIKLGVNNFIVKPLEQKQIETVFEKTLSEVTVEKELERQKMLNQLILDFQDNLLITFNNNNIINVNKSFLDFFACETLEEFNINYINLSKNLIDNNENYEKEEEWLNSIKNNSNPKNTIKLLDRENYEIRTFLIKYTDVSMFDNEFILSLTDITEIEEESKKFEVQATVDVLTKVYNRLKFNELLEYEIAKFKRYNTKLSLLMFDIDKFKLINDNYGHQVGDSVLIEISSLIKCKLRETDVVARWGGEEFMILLPNTCLKNAMKIAENLRKEIEFFKFTGVEKVTSSFGVGEFSNIETKDQLVKRIDEALYVSKTKGRNRVTVSNSIEDKEDIENI